MARYVPKHRRCELPLSEAKSKQKKEKPKKQATPRKSKNQKEVEEKKNSQEKQSAPVELNNKIPLKSQISDVSLEESKTHHHANYAEKMSFEIIKISLEDLKKRKLKSKEKKRTNDYHKAQLDRILPEIATNFVNLAIENAMQLLKSVKLYEKRNSSVVEKLDALSIQNEISTETETHIENCENSISKENNSQIDDDEETQPEKSKNCSKIEKCNDIVKINPNISSKKLTEISEKPSDKQTKSKSKTSKKTNSKKPNKSKNKRQKNTEKVEKVEEEEKKEENMIAASINNKLPLKEEAICEDEKDDLDDWDSNWTEDGECISEEMKNEVNYDNDMI